MSDGSSDSQVKTARAPWWLVIPLLLVLASFIPIMIDQKNKTQATLEKSATEISDLQTLNEPYLAQRLEVEQAEALMEANIQLQIVLDEWLDQNEGEFSIVVKELTGQQRSASVYPTEPIVPASTYKLFVVYSVLHEIENSELTLQSKTSLGRTVADCIDSLLVYSWDVCGYPMGQLVGWDELSALLNEQGFFDTDINNYDDQGEFVGDKYTTAADEAIFMEKLYRGELLNSKHTELMLTKLKEQIWRERIPAGVPDNIVVADKPGWLYEYENDAAIVYGENTTYVLVVLSNDSSVEALAELSSRIYYEILQGI